MIPGSIKTLSFGILFYFTSTQGLSANELTALFSKKTYIVDEFSRKSTSSVGKAEALCRKELEFNLIPKNCYLWMRYNRKSLNKNPGKFRLAGQALDKVCNKAVKEIHDIQVLSGLLGESILSEQCHKSLEHRGKVLEYVALKETPSVYFVDWMKIQK